MGEVHDVLNDWALPVQLKLLWVARRFGDTGEVTVEVAARILSCSPRMAQRWLKRARDCDLFSRRRRRRLPLCSQPVDNAVDGIFDTDINDVYHDDINDTPDIYGVDTQNAIFPTSEGSDGHKKPWTAAAQSKDLQFALLVKEATDEWDLSGSAGALRSRTVRIVCAHDPATVDESLRTVLGNSEPKTILWALHTVTERLPKTNISSLGAYFIGLLRKRQSKCLGQN